MDIGERLRWLRTERGMSIEKAGEASGYSAPQIKKIEGGHSPTVACLKALLDAYESNLAKFFEAVPKTVSNEDREVFERLQFILNESRRPDADEKQKSRARSISENVEEFYRGAITHNSPAGKRARPVQERSKSKASAKKHGKYMAMDDKTPKPG